MSTSPADAGTALVPVDAGDRDGSGSGDHFVDDYLDQLLGVGAPDAVALPARADPVAAAALPDAPAPAAAVAHARDASAPAAVPGTPLRAISPAEPPSVRSHHAAQAMRWLRVAVDVDSYALELLRVQEVVRVAPIVRMRGAARAVLGVMNLRGRIVPVFDLGLWLGAGDVTVSERARVVVVERNDELIGLLVSAVDDVVTLGRERIEPPMAGNAGGAMATAIVGIARVGATPTVLLDANALFG